MARRRSPPPGSARAIAAYNCGARMAEWRDDRVPRRMSQGDWLIDLMTPGELQAWRLTKDAMWSRYWWMGYMHGAREQTL